VGELAARVSSLWKLFQTPAPIVTSRMKPVSDE
jgi:hypothetical protein